MSWVTNVGPEVHFDYNLMLMLSALVFQPGKGKLYIKARLTYPSPEHAFIASIC